MSTSASKERPRVPVERPRGRHSRRRRRQAPVNFKDFIALTWMVAMFLGMLFSVQQIRGDVRSLRVAVARLNDRLGEAVDDGTLHGRLDVIEDNTEGLNAEMIRLKDKLDRFISGSMLGIN